MDLELQTTSKEWNVLLVDDEPAVHEVSRLILRGLTFDGLPVELLSAASAAQARELLSRNANIALILLDVVMETDDAGMRLVDFVREHMVESDIQIILRTGQPGMAPERDVILDYEVNGYFGKTDITAQRLRSIVITSLRSYRHARLLRHGEANTHYAEFHTQRDIGVWKDIAQATNQGLIVLQAQPQLRLDSLRLHGVDLIASWRTRRGLMSSEQVAGLFTEHAARIQAMQWLLTQSLGWARQWQGEFGTQLRVCLPLIGEFLDDTRYVEELVGALTDRAWPGVRMDLELSQNVVLRAERSLARSMERVREAGVGFVFRDFGAATVALPYLSNMAFESLKLPRLFVEGLANDPQRAAMARSLIALAQTLGATSIADGVISDSDAQFLRWEGCDVGQGPALASVCTPAELVGALHGGASAPH